MEPNVKGGSPAHKLRLPECAAGGTVASLDHSGSVRPIVDLPKRADTVDLGPGESRAEVITCEVGGASLGSGSNPC